MSAILRWSRWFRSGCKQKHLPWNSSPPRPLRPCRCVPEASGSWGRNRRVFREPGSERKASRRNAAPPPPGKAAMDPSLRPPFRLRMQHDLLPPPGRDFAYDEFVFAATVDLMDRAELAEFFSRFSKFAQNRPVQLHFVNLAGYRHGLGIVGVRVRVGTVKILMRSRGNAEGPRGADLVVDRLELQVVVENLNAAVAPVSHVDVALGVHRDRVRKVELAGRGTPRPHGFDESPVLVVLHDPGVAIAIGHEDISGGVPGHIGRPIEYIGLRRRHGSSRSRRCRCAFHGFRPPAKKHDDAPFGVELDHHIRPLIDSPDVVPRIDPHRMSEREAIQALADLTDVVPIPIEFKQPRGLASGINKNMSLGIRRDADSFAKVQIRRHLQEVWLRLEGYFGNVLNLGSGVDLGRRESLGEMGPGKRQNRDDATETWTSPHCCLLARSRTATDGRPERSRRNLRFGVQVDASIPQSGLLGVAGRVSWLGRRDSNPDTQIQSLQSYR